VKLRGRAVLLLCGIAGCGSGQQVQPEPGIDSLAREYVRLAVALGERDPDALDFYSGPPSDVADIRRDPPKLAQIKLLAGQLRGRIGKSSGVPADRRDYLLAQLRAIEARADLLGGVLRSFDQETQVFFGVAITPKDEKQLSGIRDQVDRLLEGSGNTAARFGQLESRFMIPEERVPAVMQRAVELCREQTKAHLALPEGESVRLEYVRNKPWSAFSAYKGHYKSVISVNVDFGLTIDRALELACHEGYPGHHVFNSLVERDLVAGQHRSEMTVQPVFSPQSLASEAAAAEAGDLVFSEPARLAAERDILMPIAGLNAGGAAGYVEAARRVDSLYPEELDIAREYLDGRLEFVRAGFALERLALMKQSDATLRYLNEFRTYVVTYTEGRERVSKWINAAGTPEERWKHYVALMEHPGVIPQ
jgi:hypothetical protein